LNAGRLHEGGDQIYQALPFDLVIVSARVKASDLIRKNGGTFGLDPYEDRLFRMRLSHCLISLPVDEHDALRQQAQRESVRDSGQHAVDQIDESSQTMLMPSGFKREEGKLSGETLAKSCP
jgi:hypothetical protein